MAEVVRLDISDSNNLETPSKAVYTGILPCQKIREMIFNKEISAIFSEIEEDQIQPASIDLRLGDYAYPVQTSFLPGKGVKVMDKMKQLDHDFDKFKIDLTVKDGAILERDKVYVIPLLEAINLKSEVAAFANPKSSTGRLDILTRLIADGCSVFDQLDEGYVGQLYIEVAPKSFSIVARKGDRLNQLRFRRARGETPKSIPAHIWSQLLAENRIVKDLDAANMEVLSRKSELPFTVDLQGSGADSIVGWRAKKHTKRIDLKNRNYNPYEFWEPIIANKEKTLVLEPDQFYILMTKESIAVPKDFAAEMLPYDTRAGEFRVHYAGFFDPGFGIDENTQKAGSSRGVLEVRSHEVPFLLEHGQIVGWLKYEYMAAPPDTLYGTDASSNYQGQGLKLAKQFCFKV